MSTRFELHPLRVRQGVDDAINLRHRSIFVIDALNGEYGAGDSRQRRFDIPRTKRRVKPDVVPAPERGIYVIMKTSEF